MTADENAQHSSRPAQWIILILGLAVLGFAAGANLYFEHGRVQEREETRLMLDARIIASIVDENLRSLNATLKDLQQTASTPPLPVDMDKRLMILCDALTGVRSLIILNENGVALASNINELLGKNFSHREYFETAREENDPDRLYLSPPFKTVLNTYTMLLVRAIPGPDGEFRGIVAAALDPNFFAPLLDSVLFAPDVWTNLVHGAGTIFIMRPEREGIAGKNIKTPGSLFYRHMQSGRNESMFSDIVVATGEDRLLAAKTITVSHAHLIPPLVIGVSRDRETAFAGWRNDVYLHSTFYALTVMSSVIFLYLYQRRQRESEARLAQASAVLKERDRFIRMVTDNIPGLVAYWDSNLRCRYANRPFVDWFGEGGAGVLGAPIQDVLGTELYRKNEPYVMAALRGEAQVFECELVKGDARAYALARYIPDKVDENVEGFFVLASDVSDLKNAQRELEKRVQELDELASTDPLTCIPNRRSFLARLNKECERSKRYGAPLSFLMIDVDHFKRINDEHGHDAGDAILVMLARTLEEAMRTTDMAGRLGGEEFGAIMVETGLAEAVAGAERLRESLSKVCIPTETGSTCFTVSIGAAAYGPDADSAQTLMKQADLALYHAKRTGRNRTVVFEASLANGSEEDARAESDWII